MYIFMGGTYDPIHQGHIQGALHVSQMFVDSAVHLVPAKAPVHKNLPKTTLEHRIAMLELAIEAHPELHLDLREVRSENASYTIDTLKDLRVELGIKRGLLMVIGMDSFLDLPNWRDAEQFLSLCNLLVLQRPHYDLAASMLPTFVEGHVAAHIDELTRCASGKVCFQQQPPIDISATQIRNQIAVGKSVYALPGPVLEYIEKHHLYKS